MSTSLSAESGRIRRVATPEGVTLPFRVGDVGSRLLAFIIDILVIHVTVAAIFVIGFFSLATGSDLPFAFALLMSFLLRNFYFIFLEMRFGGRTLGKWWLGLRVIARDGGPLTAEAIITRNLTRDIEVFLPLTALFAPHLIVGSGPGWGVLIAAFWLVIPALLPLFSKDRLRVGDIVGGTMVVKAPGAVLLDDLADVELPQSGWDQASEEERYRFTDEQLDLYGIHELQVLERVLRGSEGYRHQDVLDRVCKTITKKIGWSADGQSVDAHAFLFAFYKAQRARLEQRMLFGDRRERKQR